MNCEFDGLIVGIEYTFRASPYQFFCGGCGAHIAYSLKAIYDGHANDWGVRTDNMHPENPIVCSECEYKNRVFSIPCKGSAVIEQFSHRKIAEEMME